MYSQLQPFSRPKVEDLIGTRIEVLCCVMLDDNTKVLKWCQGEVLHVIAGTKVEVKWDPAPDIEGCKESTIGEQSLLPSKWNKDNKEGAWRVDVDIEVRDELDDEHDDQEEVGKSEIDSASFPDGDTQKSFYIVHKSKSMHDRA